MSILIKGMKMPENCAECKRARLQFYIKCEEHEYVSNGLQMKMRSLTCPMEELPPHGRLIDGDRLYKQVTKFTGSPHWVAIEIKQAPTIIEAEAEDD